MDFVLTRNDMTAQRIPHSVSVIAQAPSLSHKHHRSSITIIKSLKHHRLRITTQRIIAQAS
jgi:hypothetical protein